MGDNPLAADLDHVLEHTRALWEDLRGERIFITGGTGFFGCWLLESFLWANERLGLKSSAVVLTRRPEALRSKAPHLAANPALTLQVGDVRNFEFPSGTFSHVIHAATHDVRMQPVNPHDLFLSNVEGTLHILSFAAFCHTRRFLYTSSGAVYGQQPSEMTHISEDYPGAPSTLNVYTAYAQSKRSSEFLCIASASENLQIKIARCFAFAGPYLPLDTNYAFGNFVRDSLTGGPIIVKGDGSPYRSYLYAADLAIWLWKILFCGSPNGCYNVGSDEAVTIADLAHQIASVVDVNMKIEIQEQRNAAKPIERYVPSIRRAQIELGLDINIPLVESIRRTVSWHLQKYENR